MTEILYCQSPALFLLAVVLLICFLLQKAAARVAELGGFPDTYEGLLALPGIGDYTASAIASAAFGAREAAVDGNVLRVVTRLMDCHDDIADPKAKKAVRS